MRVSDNDSAACAQSRSPSIQRNDLRSSRGFGGGSPSVAGFGDAGASKAARSTPNATPSGLAAKVVCNSRPRATAPVWFEPMAPSPCVRPRRVKFRRVPSWMHSTVSCACIRRSVRSRCGARMLPTVTALSAGWSISR